MESTLLREITHRLKKKSQPERTANIITARLSQISPTVSCCYCLPCDSFLPRWDWVEWLECGQSCGPCLVDWCHSWSWQTVFTRRKGTPTGALRTARTAMAAKGMAPVSWASALVSRARCNAIRSVKFIIR